MRAEYSPIGVQPFSPHVKLGGEDDKMKRRYVVGAAIGAAMLLLAAVTYNSHGPSGLAQSATAGAPATQLVEEGSKDKDGNIFASPYSTPEIGIFTGHRHGLKGGRLTFGEGTYKNIFDPNPESHKCGFGHYTDENRDCVECPANKWCPGTNVVNECPKDSTSLPGSDALADCVCAAGTYGLAGSCKTCPAGHYCPGTGGDAKGNTEPQKCPRNSNSVEGQPVCRCNAAYYGEDFSACAPCPRDNYCPGGRVSFPCAQNMAAEPGKSICSAAPGFYGEDGQVPQVCRRNFFCPGGNVITPCGEGAVSPRGSKSDSACTCDAGWTGQTGSDCIQCPADSYCSGGSNQEKCPLSSIAPVGSDEVTDCGCKAGYVGPDAQHCSVCPEGYFCPGGERMTRCPGHSTSKQGATRQESCYCMVGFIGRDPKSCIPCPKGEYCLGGNAVNRCPANTDSEQQSWKVEQCLCVAGFYQLKVDGKPVCNQCPANKYCTGGTSVEQCPAHSKAAQGSVSRANCVCDPGYYREGGTCIASPVGKYFAGGNQGSPQSCPSRSSAPAASDSINDCVCQAGTYQVGGGRTMSCSTCPQDKFCTGNGVAQGCPDGKIADAGATSAGQCYTPSVQVMRQRGQSVPNCPHRDHQDEDSAIFYQHCNQREELDKTDSVRIGEWDYGTMDRVVPREWNMGCQNSWAGLPAGWQIAPDDADTRTAVKKRAFATGVVVLNTGKTLTTAALPPAGRDIMNGGNYLRRSGNSYMPSMCNARILIRRKAWIHGPNTVKGPNGLAYRTLDGTLPGDRAVSCQRDYIQLPRGWSIAPHDANTRQVISSYGWGTHVMAMSDGCGMHVGGGLYNPPGNIWSCDILQQSGTSFKPRWCHLRVLIVEDGRNTGKNGQRVYREDGTPELADASTGILSSALSSLTSLFGGNTPAASEPADHTSELVAETTKTASALAQEGSTADRKLLSVDSAAAGEHPPVEAQDLMTPESPDHVKHPAFTNSSLMAATTELAGRQHNGGWLSQLNRGRYATIGTNACDDDQGLCVLRNCGLPSADLSSVDIPPGMTVTLFADTHFRGRKIVLKGPMDANKHCFDSDAMEGRFWNDRTRSVIVEGPDHHV